MKETEISKNEKEREEVVKETEVRKMRKRDKKEGKREIGKMERSEKERRERETGSDRDIRIERGSEGWVEREGERWRRRERERGREREGEGEGEGEREPPKIQTFSCFLTEVTSGWFIFSSEQNRNQSVNATEAADKVLDHSAKLSFCQRDISSTTLLVAINVLR